MSVSKENFIKAIHQLEQSGSKGSRPGSIARSLGISNAAATDMARKLAEKGFIRYEKYRELKLTPAGNKMALNIIRKHRLWETFLHRVFNLSLHEIHREAELLEHETSDFLADRISRFLGDPETDPHGDPIPNVDGWMAVSKENIILSDAQPGKQYRISRLFSSEKEFFDFCQANNIAVGSRVTIEKQYDKSRMTEVEIKNRKLLLNAEMGNIIYVRKI
jgi:DtxR family Mn-dependent transcriptional regulator